MQKDIQQIGAMMPDSGRVSFGNDPITIKLTPHSWPIKVYGVQVVFTELQWQDRAGKWNRLEGGDKMAPCIVQSIYQRMKLLSLINN